MPTKPQTGAQIRAKAQERANAADYKAIMKKVEKALELLDEAVELAQDTTPEVRQQIKASEFHPVAHVFNQALFLNNMIAEPAVTYTKRAK